MDTFTENKIRTKKLLSVTERSIDPRGIRTRYLQLRRLSLYPIELGGQNKLPEETKSDRAALIDYLSFARSTNEPSRVSITMRSSVLQKRGTLTSIPVSRVAGFVDFPDVSPLIPGSQ